MRIKLYLESAQIGNAAFLAHIINISQPWNYNGYVYTIKTLDVCVSRLESICLYLHL